ncbi:hypothetical protein [Paenibacillus dendritiformis]|uniref:hypothetical protein n=1 Tax=Paenibacillus dendritiformis TaxID=130049 RepID=UPI000DAA3801|nr:hypothetical protein [Paenibacillus dendritiformis]PZM63471.1 hypothetical protein DOE73_21770 [Paenibacillus dendritiformis]
MEKIDPRKIIETLLNIRQIVQAETSAARDEIVWRQDEYNDLSHLLEFGKLNAVELCKIGKELGESKRVRREALNKNELLTPLYEYFSKNQSFFNGLEQIRIDIEKTKKVQAKRRYEVRVREDLKEQLEKVQNR